MSDEDRIRRRAHEIWESEGRPEGRREEHWARARRETAGADAPGDAAASTGLGQDPDRPPQMPVPGLMGGSPGTGDVAGLSGAAAAAGGHHPGIGASMTDSPPRIGPAPVAADDAEPGIADAGSAHGPSAADRGKGRAAGQAPSEGAPLTAREAGLGAGGMSGEETPGRIGGRG